MARGPPLWSARGHHGGWPQVRVMVAGRSDRVYAGLGDRGRGLATLGPAPWDPCASCYDPRCACIPLRHMGCTFFEALRWIPAFARFMLQSGRFAHQDEGCLCARSKHDC